jgi:hypothetical protein
MNLWSESRILVSDSGVISATFKDDSLGWEINRTAEKPPLLTWIAKSTLCNCSPAAPLIYRAGLGRTKSFSRTDVSGVSTLLTDAIVWCRIRDCEWGRGGLALSISAVILNHPATLESPR